MLAGTAGEVYVPGPVVVFVPVNNSFIFLNPAPTTLGFLVACEAATVPVGAAF